jgi:predicted NBD/HSP70 family sugar kinase
VKKPSPKPFRVATRTTGREINRHIALTLIRTHQPISRADLARRMGTTRGAVSLLVNELIEEGMVYEGATGEASRGRKPTFLYMDSRGRCAVAVDIRATRSYLMITDLVGRQLMEIGSFATDLDPARFVKDLAGRVRRLLAEHKDLGRCAGIGVVVPGMIDRDGENVMHAPALGWRDTPLRRPLAAATGLPVLIENSGKACALSLMWSARGDQNPPADLVFVSVSDGVGVGVTVRGELLRGRHNVAGEFGHVPLSIDGPPCACGARGCWEAYVSNLATLGRYFGRPLVPGRPIPSEVAAMTVDDLILRARGGDGKALAAIQSTARYLGLGLASIVNALDPDRIYVGGEITTAWDLIEPNVRAALAERALLASHGDTDIAIVKAEDYPRLRGAAALVGAPAFAASVPA